MQQVHASACDVTGLCIHLTGLCMHVLHALPHDITGRCMHLLHGLCCFDLISDIPLSPATLNVSGSLGWCTELKSEVSELKLIIS
jgi:hypothetical protein